jgi:hypothetical protein
MHRYRTQHDKAESRIPIKHVQETEDTGRISHARDHEPGSEKHARKATHEEFHCATPIQCRMTNTTSIATAMKMPVAANERGDKRLMPHTP